MYVEIFFKTMFFVILFSFAYVITAFTQKAKSRKENVSTRIQMHHEHEVPLLLKLRQIFGIPFYVGVLIWTFAPRWMEWSALELPIWLRWTGLGLGIFAVFLNGWSHRTLSLILGKDFDPVLRLLRVPALVTTGPYAKIRHPIYLAFFSCKLQCYCFPQIGLLGVVDWQ